MKENWCIHHPIRSIIDVAVEETHLSLVSVLKQDKCQTSSFLLVYQHYLILLANWKWKQ